MIVIMRDAIMPDCCNTCVCSEGYGCGITGTIMTTKEMESRPDWCPLEEVEPCEHAVSKEAVSSWLKQYGQDVLHGKYKFSLMYIWKNLMDLPSVTPKQRWIPWDSGKFPKESGMYTVTAYDGATKRVTYAKYQKRLKRWELTGARAYWRVLAWMPLPEPYKGGEQDE